MFTLSCESTADLTKRYFDERNIPVLPYSYSVDGEEYLDDMGENGGLDKLYTMLDQDKKPSTSQISEEKYLTFFSNCCKKAMCCTLHSVRECRNR